MLQCWASISLAEPPGPSRDKLTSFSIGRFDPPPEPIASLVQNAKIQWQYGPRDPSREPSSGPRLAAETQYRIAYQFNSGSRWRIVPGEPRTVIIRVRYQHVRWNRSHVIWFRNQPDQSDFWNDPLVRHELDHLKISSDPRFEKQFLADLQASSIIRQTASSGETIDQRWVSNIVDRHVAKVFEKTSELIAIRYLELDQITSHGRRPLPDDSELANWMRSDDDGADDQVDPN